MKILSICQDDFANFMYDNMKALRSVGLDCDSVKLQIHPFYREQSEIVSMAELSLKVRDYDIIQFFHDNTNLYNQLQPRIDFQKIIVYHTSSYYRANSANVNKVMSNAWRHVACMPEFMAMCPGAIYMVGAVDTDFVKASGYPKLNNFGHFPSNSKVKGTEKIINLFTRYDLFYLLTYNTEIVSRAAQLARMDGCTAYIEMFTEKDGLDSEYGNFGITALEAAALSLPVITQCKDLSVYQKYYGTEFFVPVVSEMDFLEVVRDLSDISVAKEAGRAARELVVKNHSYKATGEYFIKNVLNAG